MNDELGPAMIVALLVGTFVVGHVCVSAFVSVIQLIATALVMVQ